MSKFRHKMPFGKHKGEFLEDVPVDYLIWVVDKVREKRLVDAMLKIINRSDRDEPSDLDREYRNIVG